MIRSLTNKIILYLLLFISFSLCPLIGVAGVVTALGQSLITSTINVEEYRQRAIENALQSIINDKNLYLNSFSIVENGQVLFDQIQSKSTASILSFEVTDEYAKDNIYYVNIKAIVDEDLTSSNKATCRKTQISEVDVSISLLGNSVKFPAWFLLSDDWLETEIKKQRFSHDLNFIQEKNYAVNSETAYSLFKREENISHGHNPYELRLKTTVKLLKQNYILMENENLEVHTQATIFRSGKPFSSHDINKEFRVAQKFGVDFEFNSRRKLWKQSKKDLIEALHGDIQSLLDNLKCVTIEPKLKQQGSINYISFGENDGIKSDDIFVVANDSPKKLYFKVGKISAHQAEIELISKFQKTETLVGQTLKLVEGL